MTTEYASLEEVIKERDFVRILENNVQKFFRIYHFLRDKGVDEISKRSWSHLLEEAHELESFLDDYNARNNRTYSYLTELVASIRNLTLAAHTLRHILNRYFKYHLGDDVAQLAAFQNGARDALSFCSASVKALFEEAYRECSTLGVRIEADTVVDENWFTDRIPKRYLPHNVDEGVVSDEDQRIAELASKYVRVAEEMARIPANPSDDYESLKDFVARYVTEELARARQAQIHSIQSKYDTYVKNTVLETRHEELKTFRGHVSMALHLLEVTTFLVHFYERHENDIRFEDTKLKIARKVDKRTLLQVTLRFAFAQARRYLARGRSIAEAVVKQYTQVIRADLDLPEGIYLHARPASLIVAVINHFGTPVTMQMGEARCDANSIIQVLMLAGQNSKARQVTFHGDEKPLKDLRLLFESGLGEQGLEKLPSALDYLKQFGI